MVVTSLRLLLITLSLRSLPDILALSSAEVQLPTLNMSSSELGDISLSGLINTIIAPEQADQVHNQMQNVSLKKLSLMN